MGIAHRGASPPCRKEVVWVSELILTSDPYMAARPSSSWWDRLLDRIGGVTHTSGRTIDWVVASDDADVVNVQVLPRRGIGDHNPVLVTYTL